jgi:hypothetical protein
MTICFDNVRIYLSVPVLDHDVLQGRLWHLRRAASSRHSFPEACSNSSECLTSDTDASDRVDWLPNEVAQLWSLARRLSRLAAA